MVPNGNCRGYRHSSLPFTPSGSNVDIMATAPQMLRLNTTLNQHSLTANVKVNDVGSLVEEQMTASYMRGSRVMDWTDYHDFNTVSDVRLSSHTQLTPHYLNAPLGTTPTTSHKHIYIHFPIYTLVHFFFLSPTAFKNLRKQCCLA